MDFRPDVVRTAPEPLEAPGERPDIIFDPAKVSSKAPKMLPPEFSLEAKKGFGSRNLGGQKYILRTIADYPGASRALDEGSLNLYAGAKFDEGSDADLNTLHGALAQALARDGAKRLRKSGVQLTIDGKTQRISLYDLGHLLQQRLYPDLAKAAAPSGTGFSAADVAEGGAGSALKAKKLIDSRVGKGPTLPVAVFDAMPESEYGTFMKGSTQARYFATRFAEMHPADAEFDKAGLQRQLQRAETEYLSKYERKYTKGVKGKSPGEMQALTKSMEGEDLDAASTESLLSMRGRLAAIDGAASKFSGLSKSASSKLSEEQNRMYRGLGEQVLEERIGPDEDVTPILKEYGLLSNDDEARLKKLLVGKLGEEGAEALIAKKGLIEALGAADVFNEDEMDKLIAPLWARLEGEVGRGAAKTLAKEKGIIGALQYAGIPIDDVLLLRDKISAHMRDLSLVVGKKEAESRLSDWKGEPESQRALGAIRMERLLSGTMGQLLDTFGAYGVALPQGLESQMRALKSSRAFEAHEGLSEESKAALTPAFENLQDAMGRSMLDEYGPFALSKKGRATISGYEDVRAMGKDFSGVQSNAAMLRARVDEALEKRRQAWVEAYASQLQAAQMPATVVPPIIPS